MPDFAKALRGLERGKERGLKAATTDWKSQLAKYVVAGFSPRSVLPPGEIRSNAFGSHYITRASYPHDYFHGRVRLGRLSSPDLDFLMRLMCEKGNTPDRERIVFLDTETTGVQGGTGICPFLIGLGFPVEDDFLMLQFFIRDFDEEPSMLLALSELLRQFELVVTYNGAAFDIPLLETRFTLARLDSPFERMSHFDLLFTARKLWRNGHGSCRLGSLERELLSFMRGPDIPGAEIPRAYFDYLQRRASTTLYSVFTHNVYDVLSLAALTVHACDRVTFEPASLDEPLDLYSLGRIFENSVDWRRSLRLYEMALTGGVADPMRQKILERLAVVCRRAGEHQRSREVCQELMKSTEFSIVGYEGAAIHAERIARDYDSASRFLEEGLSRTGNPRTKRLLQSRLDRLRQKAILF
jgi:uncharacterized protein YprB with RNaseH-like and TPR domain